uniref:4'-phosphopantetheinyl transferase superfamily protein n=1 Tax=Streptomyces angustmyceticus TaxID=285578 RepID=UPI00117FDAEF
ADGDLGGEDRAGSRLPQQLTDRVLGGDPAQQPGRAGARRAALVAGAFGGAQIAAHHQLLRGRIAAKDAVRELLWESGAGPVFPAEVAVGKDHDGRPRPEGPLAAGLHLSLAHKDHVAVALAHRSGPVGIDIEPVTDDPQALERIALTPAERRLADALQARETTASTGRAYWLTALWCAKEAAAKAAGSGLGGRPLEWAVTSAPGGALRVLSPSGQAHLVHLDSVHDLSARHVVAWTGPPPEDRTGTVTPTSTEATHGS